MNYAKASVPGVGACSRHRRASSSSLYASQTAPGGESVSCRRRSAGDRDQPAGGGVAARFSQEPRAREPRDAHREGDRRRAAQARLRGDDRRGRHRRGRRAEGRHARARWWRCAPTWTRCRSPSRCDLPFKSTAKAQWNGQEVGVMHACGHDNHMAILLGAATVLAKMRDRLPGTVKLIFQPAEEGPGRRRADDQGERARESEGRRDLRPARVSASGRQRSRIARDR